MYKKLYHIKLFYRTIDYKMPEGNPYLVFRTYNLTEYIVKLDNKNLEKIYSKLKRTNLGKQILSFVKLNQTKMNQMNQIIKTFTNINSWVIVIDENIDSSDKVGIKMQLYIDSLLQTEIEITLDGNQKLSYDQIINIKSVNIYQDSYVGLLSYYIGKISDYSSRIRRVPMF
jgi:hypothetical protein